MRGQSRLWRSQPNPYRGCSQGGVERFLGDAVFGDSASVLNRELSLSRHRPVLRLGARGGGDTCLTHVFRWRRFHRIVASRGLLGGQSVSTSISASLQDVSSVGRAHADAEAVRLAALAVVGLERAFHRLGSLIKMEARKVLFEHTTIPAQVHFSLGQRVRSQAGVPSVITWSFRRAWIRSERAVRAGSRRHRPRHQENPSPGTRFAPARSAWEES